MKESSKALRRRVGELERGEFPWGEVFKGKGVDVGSGDDPLRDCEFRIADSDKAFSHDLPDGGGDDLEMFFCNQTLDFIHGSQVLEHARDPVFMLRSWIACLKPGGYIVATVPDWKLYEKCVWPSRWNAGHKSAWTNDASEALKAIQRGVPIILMPDFIQNSFDSQVDLVRYQLVDTKYDYAAPPTVDQTFKYEDGVECFHEFVLKRR